MKLTITIETDEAAEHVANTLAGAIARATGVQPVPVRGPATADEAVKRKRRTKAEIEADEAAAAAPATAAPATAAPATAAPATAAPATAAPATAAPATAAPGITLDALRAAISPLVADPNRRDAVKAILTKHGASNLSSLTADKYADVLIDLGLSA